MPQRIQDISRTRRAVPPSAVLYRISWGFSRILLIINAASQSSRIPCRQKEAAMGMVPYIQRGDAVPRRLAGITPQIPIRLLRSPPNRLWMAFFANTEIREPITIPSTQYRKICRSCTMK